jgi:flagella basal body P-ring formation protein FlgA
MYNPCIRLIVFLTLLCILPRTARVLAAGEPACSLRSETQVSGGGVFLQDLLEDAGLPFNPKLCPAPPAGKPLVFTRDQIAALLPRTNALPPTTNWAGAASVRIFRKARNLEENELSELLTGVLQREQVSDRGELELHFARPWTPVVIPDDPFILSIREIPANGVSGNFLTRFELRAGRESLGVWVAALEAHVWKEVLVAGSTLRRGQSLAEADLGRQRVDLLSHRDALIGLPSDAGQFEFASTIPAGNVVTMNYVRRRPLVLRGKVIEAVVQSGALEITVKAEALEDGLAGQFIRLRNLNSKREFRGKVLNEDSVVIAL